MSSLFAKPTRNAPSKSFWQGERVRLRGIEPEDAEIFHQWNYDAEMGRSTDFLWPTTSLTGTRGWAQKMATQEFKDDLITSAIEDLQGNLVGSINSHSTNRRTGTFGYGVAIGTEYRGRGYASEAVTLLLRYFFEELRYQKVTTTVYAFNAASIRLHEKLGFQLEGRLRRMVYTKGQYFDELFFGMTSEEFAERYGS
jgi:RimJ/RimL family protein N-acetyltransferase